MGEFTKANENSAAAKNPEVMVHVAETPASQKKGKKKAAIVCALCVVLVLVVGSIVAAFTAINHQPTESDLVVSVNVSLNLLRHPELLDPPNAMDLPEAMPEPAARRNLRALAFGYSFGINNCNYWNNANPDAVKYIKESAPHLKHVLDTCSNCHRLDYSVPGFLLEDQPNPQILLTQSIESFREKHPGWGSYTCGKGDESRYGIYRGGSSCQGLCCKFQEDYCRWSWGTDACFWTWGPKQHECMVRCKGKRGCLAPKGAGARH